MYCRIFLASPAVLNKSLKILDFWSFPEQIDAKREDDTEKVVQSKKSAVLNIFHLRKSSIIKQLSFPFYTTKMF